MRDLALALLLAGLVSAVLMSLPIVVAMVSAVGTFLILVFAIWAVIRLIRYDPDDDIDDP